MGNPALVSVPVGAVQLLEIKTLPPEAPGYKGLIMLRRVGGLLSPPDWFSLGVEKVQGLAGALDSAGKEPTFQQDLSWYGDRNILRVRRIPAQPNVREMVLLEIRREKADGTYEFVDRKGARLEIPLPYLGKVRSVILNAARNMGGMTAP